MGQVILACRRGRVVSDPEPVHNYRFSGSFLPHRSPAFLNQTPHFTRICVTGAALASWPGVNTDTDQSKVPDSRAPQDIGEAIMAYLEQHPQSCDTAVGITRWWLPRCGLESGLEQVKEALGELVRRGLLQAVERPGGDTHYVLRKSQRNR